MRAFDQNQNPTYNNIKTATSNEYSQVSSKMSRDARSILELQTTSGNQAVLRLLHPHTEERQAEQSSIIQRYSEWDNYSVWDDYATIPHENPLHERKEAGSAESIVLDPKSFYLVKINEQRKALSESIIGPELNNLIATLKEDVDEWKKFRTGQHDMEVVPGTRSANAARNFRDAVIYAQTNPHVPKAIRRLGFRYYTSFIRRHLTGTDVTHIEHMSRFNTTRGILTGALQTVLGVNIDGVKHDYKMQVVWTSGGKVGAILGGGIFVRKLRIFYTNDIGMAYTTEMKVGTVQVSASGGYGVQGGPGKKPSFGPSDDKLLEDGSVEGNRTGEILEGMGYDGEESGIELIDSVPGTNAWWRPEDFDEAVLAIFKVGGEIGVGASLAGVGGAKVSIAEKNLTEIFMFDTGGKTLAFDTTSIESKMKQKDEEAQKAGKELIETLKKIKVTDAKETGASLGFSGSMEWEIGGVISNEVTQEGATRDVEPADQRQYREWTYINVTSIYFDTGSAKISAESNEELRKIAQQVANHAEKFPDAEFLFDIVGHASPRWDHTKGK
ncbi:MAG: hypothetical protein M3220_15760, partial [Chloroflexota bacterium]|nr:hypothetical protein [Chloroflexota bacterium]